MKLRRSNRIKGLVLAGIMCLALVPPVDARADDGLDVGYTYNYDFWNEVRYSPDAYEVVGVYTAVDLGLETNFKNPDGLFVYGDLVFVCDT